MPWTIKYISVFCLILFTAKVFAQKGTEKEKPYKNNVRRHYLIAIDISGPFTSKLRSTPELKRALIALFQNEIPKSSVNENTINLVNGTKNSNRFFNPKLDEISYFQFGITQNEMERLRPDRYKNDTILLLDNFINSFIENQNINWSSYQLNTPNVQEYINEIFKTIPYRGFGGGVTLSNYVYPLVMDKINTQSYVNEYILIILSDFLTGSEFGNRNDFLRLKDIYRYNYSMSLPPKAAPIIIRNYINNLSNAFYPVNYFEYAFISRSNGNNIGIIAYKIRPKAGKTRLEDVNIFIDGNIELEQRSHKGSSFNLSETLLRFTHNKWVTIEEILLSVNTDSDTSQNASFKSIIAKRNDKGWHSEYSGNNLLMAYDSTSMSYKLPTIKKLVLQPEYLGNVELTYIANVSFQPLNNTNKSINYSFQTVRNIREKDVEYKSKLTIIIMTYLVPIVVVVLLLVIFILLARPKAIALRMATQLNDSFEEINYQKIIEDKNSGRHILPYLRWSNDMSSQPFIIEGFIIQGISIFRWLWWDSANIKLVKEKSLSGFEIYIKDNSGNISGTDDDLKLSVSKQGKFEFIINVEKVDNLSEIDKHNRFQFVLEASYERSFFLFSKSLKSKPLDYSFFVGPDLGNVWVGIDPGTTGSCIASGADGFDEVFIPRDKNDQDVIIPSVITFLKNADNSEMRGALPFREKRYYYGTSAKAYSSRSEYNAESFRSIKKMLGFKDEKKLVFTKEPLVTYNLKGKELSYLLCKGVYKELEKAITRKGKNEFLESGSFKPQRAIVAIPNNFTAHKIQDITDSIHMLKKFKEIRCIYEAEANLMYYLFGSKQITEDSTILLFDMGGATINVTIVTIHEEGISDEKIYNIDIIGKLGYGIGGDTIDYIIIKYISNYLNGLGIYIDPFNNSDVNLKEKLVDLSFSVKLEIIENFEKSADYLIDNTKLASFINEAFSTNITIDHGDEIMNSLSKLNNKYAFFDDEIIQNLLYKNIETVVQDILILYEDDIDHVIFSGRSVVFPLVQDTIMNSLRQENRPQTHCMNIDKLKSAVAIGACLYGMNKNRIKLNTTKVNSWFGVKRTTGADDFDFIKLIDIGTIFPENGEALMSIKKRKKIESNFGFDGGMVNFFQVMGSNPREIFIKGEKHKFSLLQQARLNTQTEGVGIEVWENDEILCEVKEKGTLQEKKYSTVINDQVVSEANDEHYTWIIQ